MGKPETRQGEIKYTYRVMNIGNTVIKTPTRPVIDDPDPGDQVRGQDKDKSRIKVKDKAPGQGYRDKLMETTS